VAVPNKNYELKKSQLFIEFPLIFIGILKKLLIAVKHLFFNSNYSFRYRGTVGNAFQQFHDSGR